MHIIEHYTSRVKINVVVLIFFLSAILPYFYGFNGIMIKRRRVSMKHLARLTLIRFFFHRSV